MISLFNIQSIFPHLGQRRLLKLNNKILTVPICVSSISKFELRSKPIDTKPAESSGRLLRHQFYTNILVISLQRRRAEDVHNES